LVAGAGFTTLAGADALGTEVGEDEDWASRYGDGRDRVCIGGC
jgi:hypothetical protein